MTPVLGALFIYPIKSAAGIECDRVELGPHGLCHDREWMIVDATGRGITQREESRLALLRTAIHDGRLHLSAPEGAGPALPLEHEGERVEVQVWSSRCMAFDAGAEAAAFLSGWLGRPLRPEMVDEFARLGVDPCGERGEYHTAVTNSPLFSAPIEVVHGERVFRSGCHAMDVFVSQQSSVGSRQASVGSRGRQSDAAR